MTHPRAPRTYADATTRVAGVIGWEGVCSTTGRSLRAVRYWSDPESQTVPSIAQAQALDAAYIAAGGQGAPFLDTMEFQLGIQVQRQEACTRALLDEIAIAVSEAGDAMAAAIRVTQSNASPLDALRAFAEAEQAASAFDALMRRLSSFLPSDVSGPGKDGGNVQ